MPLIQWILNLLDAVAPVRRVGCLSLSQRERATVRLEQAPRSTVALSQSARATCTLVFEDC